MNKNKANAVLVGSSLGFRTDVHINFEESVFFEKHFSVLLSEIRNC